MDAVAKLDGKDAYRSLRTRFGVLRASDRFWSFSDRMHDDHKRALPIASGLFDYNRLEAY